MGRQQQQRAGWQKLSSKKLTAQVINEHMLLVPGVLTVAEAQRFIDAAESAGFEHQGSRGPAYGEAFRDNHRISMHDVALAEQLWSATGLHHMMKGVSIDGAEPVGLNPNIRFYRYSRGQKFGKHVDDSVEVAPGQFTGYTLLIYLSGNVRSKNDSEQVTGAPSSSSSSSSSSSNSSSKRKSRPSQEKSSASAGQGAAAAVTGSLAGSSDAVQPLIGGETIFYGSRGRVVASVAPVPGLALLHLHGEDDCLEHEAAEVQQGVKYVLRSDVVFALPGRAHK